LIRSATGQKDYRKVDINKQATESAGTDLTTTAGQAWSGEKEQVFGDYPASELTTFP